MEIKNKKAYFDYEILKEYEAGLELFGTEIKSIRKGSVDLRDSFVTIKDNEAYIKKNHAKVLIGLSKGKKLYDKRESIKKRDLEREQKRQF